MADKKLLVVAFLFLCLLGVGVASAVDALMITPVPVNGEFDFNNAKITVNHSLADPVSIRAYKNDALLDGFPQVVNPAPISLEIDLGAKGFVLNDNIILEAYYANGTFVSNTTVKINPQAPTFANFAFGSDAIIEDDNVTFSVEISDTSALKDDTIIATVSVNTSCTQAILKSVPVTLQKVQDTITYKYQDFGFEYPCEYSIVVNATDVYGNAGASATQKLNVAELLCADLACLKGKINSGTSDELDFDIISVDNSPVKYGVGRTYVADLDSNDGKYGIHDVSLAFADTTETKTLVSSEIDVGSAADHIKVLSDMDMVEVLKDGFEVKIAPSVVGKACFLGADVVGTRDFVFYCSGNTTTDCDSESDWNVRALENNCIKNAESINSFFVLATCKNDNWDDQDDVCEEETASNGGSNDDTTTSNDEDELVRSSNIVNIGGTDVFGNGGTAASGAATTNMTGEGGLLSGFGAFFTENTGTSISIAIGVLLTICLTVFVIYRIRKSRVSSGSAPLLQQKEVSRAAAAKGRVSIHELAKRHDVHKPKNPKDKNKLKEFVDIALMLGHDPKDLGDSLKYRGWDPDMVDDTIRAAGFRDAKEV